MNIPATYDYLNTRNAVVSPSTVHCNNTGLQRYFSRYLLQKAISVYKWEMPETWSKDYFLYCLYTYGNLAIFDSKKFGVIPQACTLSGYDVFYRPNRVLISNPSLPGFRELRIDKDCTIIKLMPDWCGIMDKVNFYADMMSLTAESAGVNILNSKLAYIFASGDKTAAESFKKLYDQVASGEPAAFVDKNLFKDDGSPNWQVFEQNLSGNYITGDLLADLRQWENEFCTDVGLPNSNTQKRERLITDEVNANNVETYTMATLWLETLQDGVEKATAMFPELAGQFSVDWANPPAEADSEPEEGLNDDE